MDSQIRARESSIEVKGIECSGMTPRYAKLERKILEFGELPGRTSQAKRGDKSRAEPTGHSGGERYTRTLYSRVKTPGDHTVVG